MAKHSPQDILYIYDKNKKYAQITFWKEKGAKSALENSSKLEKE